MKRVFEVLGTVAVAAVLLSSCSKQENVINGGTVQMSINASVDEGTKTVLGSDGTVAWSTSGEKLEVFQKAGEGTGAEVSYKESSEGTTDDSGKTMTFTVGFDASTKTAFEYYALYPSSAYVTNNNKDVEQLKVELASSQTPSESSFGAGADLLIAKPVTGLSEQPTSLDFQFARIVAVGKMKITDLNSTENVTSVTFTATGKTLAGRSYVNLSTGLVEEYGYSGIGIDKVVLDYSAQSIAANGMTAYFTCWPCEFTADDTFEVKVETESKIFTKTVTIASDGALAFKEGRASAFTVSFSGIEGDNKAGEYNDAYLAYDDIKDSTDWGDSYDKIYSYTQSNGAIWTIACYKNTAIQLGNCSKNNSFVKLPEFSQNISSVTVVLSDALASGKTLFLATSKDATSGNITSLTGDGSVKEFTFDLAEKDVKTGYLRATGAAKILSVLVVAGNRTVLSTPQNVMAGLATDSANSIDVVWDAVENAGSYVVTATPTEGKTVSQTVTETSCTLTDLAYETTYSISVVAKSSDYSLYQDSSAGLAEEDVTTLAKPSGAASYKEDFSGSTIGTGSSYVSSSWIHALSSTSWSVTYCSNKIEALSSNKKNIAIGKKGSVDFTGDNNGITALSFDYYSTKATTLKITIKNATATVYEKETSLSKTASGSISLSTTDFSAECGDAFTVTIANNSSNNAIQISAVNWTSAK